MHVYGSSRPSRSSLAPGRAGRASHAGVRLACLLMQFCGQCLGMVCLGVLQSWASGGHRCDRLGGSYWEANMIRFSSIAHIQGLHEASAPTDWKRIACRLASSKPTSQRLSHGELDWCRACWRYARAAHSSSSVVQTRGHASKGRSWTFNRGTQCLDSCRS